MDDEQTVVIEPAGQADKLVIWLHGLGADGHDFEPIVPELRLDPGLNIRFVFPHAPMMPVTINQGFVMRAWYDIDPGARHRISGFSRPLERERRDAGRRSRAVGERDLEG